MKIQQFFLLLCLVCLSRANNTTVAPECESEDTGGGLHPAISLPCVFILICFSGLFSGLTLGLLGLDLRQLEIVASGNSSDRDYAISIIPVRQHGNFLLCTLLLGNVAVNAALSILLANMTSGLVGFLVSTVIIVIFGEIIPQASCSRYALYIGAHTVSLVRILMAIMSPAAYPVSLVLDYVLGPEFGNMYSNMELKKLIELHKEDDLVELDQQTAKMLEGALTFHDQKVASCMTPWDHVYKIDINDRLNFEVLLTICKRGHSRVPVVQTVLGQERVCGLLIVKDLILVDPEDEIPVATVLDLFEHKVMFTNSGSCLTGVLKDFQKGLSHLAIVRDVDNSSDKDPQHVMKGIITLEDIIELILQENIVDEFDNFVSMRSQAKTNREFDVNKLEFFNYRHGVKGVMSSVEASAVYHHLIKTIRVCSHNMRKMSERGLKNMLRTLQVETIKVADRSDIETTDKGGLVLYQSGVVTEYFTLVLEGRVEVLAGRQKFRSEQARWSMFCAGVLENAHKSFVSRAPTLDFVPDFTCRILKDSRLLRIHRDQFLACLQGKYDNVDFNDDFEPSIDHNHDPSTMV